MSKKTQKNYMIFRKPRTRTIKALNNIYVINTISIEALSKIRNKIANEKNYKIDFEIPIISGDRIVVARRKSKILRLLDNTISRDLFKQSLISAVAITEDFLFTNLKRILIWYPQKLSASVTGLPTEKKIELDIILEADDLDALLSNIIEKQIIKISYESPQNYFKYLENVFSFTIPQKLKDTYSEIKSSRDILIHNAGVINKIYIKKSGKYARGSIGDNMPLDSNYFDEAMKCMKRLIQTIYSKLLQKYGNV